MTSVLVISAAPDGRQSSRSLQAIVDELRRRDPSSVEMWFLRPGPDGTRPAESRVVDDLRLGSVPRFLERVGLVLPASAVRGAQLRRWWAEAAPDLVVLDDGLGSRVLARRGFAVAIRVNPEPPLDALLEPPPRRSGDLVLVDPLATASSPTADGAVVLEVSQDTADLSPAIAAADPAVVARSRAALGVPPGAPLVVGWGDGGWLDGPDLFVRFLWTLEHDHGIEAYGAWLGIESDRGAVERLVAEAARCGLGDRYVRSDDASLPLKLAGDAVFLPCRVAGDRGDVVAAVVSGLEVTTFPTHDLVDEAVHVVDHLDLTAAATAVAASLGHDRTERSEAARRRLRRLDVVEVVDRLLRAAAGIARR